MSSPAITPQELFEHQGYIVIAFRSFEAPFPVVGSVIPLAYGSVNIGPLMVTAISTRNEWETQADFLRIPAMSHEYELFLRTVAE